MVTPNKILHVYSCLLITVHHRVLEALSREFREGLPMELFYANDLVLMAESEELLMEKLRKWKKGMETKGLRVNAGKTKVMQCRVSRFQSEDPGQARIKRGKGVLAPGPPSSEGPPATEKKQ